MSNKVLESVNINKFFYQPEKQQILKDVSIQVDRGEFISIIGKSGCGKSTLLYILSTMDTDYEGDLLIDKVSMKGKNDGQLSKIRNEKIGFVFQFHYLLNEFSALKNVMLPALKLGKYSHQEIEQRAYEKLRSLDMQDYALKNANLLSGGQKQRVAIARALINDPVIIMCDEPTGNLDKKNSQVVFEIFCKLAKEQNQTLLIVTHDTEFATGSDRIIEMADGKII
jgi:lipoprotein-releasing system ATP-binding protein